MSALVEKLQVLFEPTVQSENCELWGIEYISQGKHSILRVFIDAEEGVTVENCAAVSHQLSGMLDVHDPISGEYSLEVSSPGMERPLFLPKQYHDYIGECISVRTSRPFQNQRKFTGILINAGEREITITENGSEVTLPYSAILKSHLVAIYE